MAYDEGMAQRLRDVLAGQPNVHEKKMFGGLAFMVNGHMCVGVNGEELMVRVGADQYAEAMSRPHAREMDFTGKALKGFVYVAVEGTETDTDLEKWVALALGFIESLPPK